MENQTINLSTVAKKFDSVEATIEGPLSASNDKQYFKAKFEENTIDDDGYSSQSRAYTKCFFEDSHSLIFSKCQRAVEDGTHLKIRAARISMKTPRDFYILDSEGKRQTNKNGDYRTGSAIVMFLLPDESASSQFKSQCNQITANSAWVEKIESEEEMDAEETVTVKK